jgi:DNA-binding transcriptional ArsR family regulator
MAAERVLEPPPLTGAVSGHPSRKPSSPPGSAHRNHSTDTRRLGRLVGETRALILDLLSGPQTTEDVAAHLALARSTVSQHLTALTAIGIVSRSRGGPFVYYELNERGRDLLALFPRPDRALTPAAAERSSAPHPRRPVPIVPAPNHRRTS